MKTHRMIRALAVLAGLALASPALGQTQQGSPIADMMTRARNSLNDLRYSDADSIARFVLAFGDLLTKQQRIEALQVRAAASYPDEPGAQSADSALAHIKQLIALGATGGLPREITWPGLDSLFSMVARVSQPAKVLLGTRTEGTILYVDGQPSGVVQGLRVVQVPAGRPVQLSLRAEGCEPWDSTLVAQAADSIRIGYRYPRCSK